MDAVKFIEERRRMCKATRRYSPIMLEGISPKDIVKEVEEWSAAHQHKTRQEVFLEQYPNVKCNDNIVAICPKVIDINFSCPIEGSIDIDCSDCLHKFWLQKVK